MWSSIHTLLSRIRKSNCIINFSLQSFCAFALSPLGEWGSFKTRTPNARIVLGPFPLWHIDGERGYAGKKYFFLVTWTHVTVQDLNQNLTVLRQRGYTWAYMGDFFPHCLDSWHVTWLIHVRHLVAVLAYYLWPINNVISNSVKESLPASENSAKESLLSQKSLFGAKTVSHWHSHRGRRGQPEETLRLPTLGQRVVNVMWG